MEKVIIDNVDPVEELPEEDTVNSDSDYIAAAFNAITTVEGMDTAIMSKMDEKRIKRIKRQSLKIIAHCLNNMYEELFEDNSDDATDE
jgi:hypothetical protein